MLNSQDRRDHLRIAALQQAVHFAANREVMLSDSEVVAAAEKFVEFLEDSVLAPA